ncbi:ATP-binding protein [Terasakiella sp.]|uniref:sensor histidine kinase n=1 Tax=Terasakiella sp. TaxID=2034861 RepID=UPI003AA84634
MKNREIKIAYLVAIIATLASIIYGGLSFNKTKTRDLAYKAQMVTVIIKDRLENLQRTAYDYSYWNDTIDKALIAKDREWADSNIGEYLLDTFGLSQTLLFDAQNNLIFAFGADHSKLTDTLTSHPAFRTALTQTLSRKRNSPQASGFYFRNKENVYLVAISALTREAATGSRTEDEKGYLVLLKEITPDILTKISKNFGVVNLSLQPNADKIKFDVLDEVSQSSFPLYFTPKGYSFTDLIWNLLPFLITILSLVYLLSVIQRKSIQSQKLNRDLEQANIELATFNKRLEEQVRRQTVEIMEKAEKSEQASRAKSTFLSSMSHELRTPLNGILGFAQMLGLNKDQNLTAKQKAWITQIVNSGRMLLDIVNDVLDLARIESGRAVYQPEIFRPREVFKECFDIVEPIAATRHISLSGHPETDLYVYVDRSKLKQVLLNLVSNAIKYGKDNGYVKFGCRTTDNQYIELYVEDNGKGIPETDLPHIFEPFRRVKETSLQVEGTGVGLAIVQKNLDLMGGQIKVESTLGEGSRFSIYLKAYDEDYSPAPDHEDAAL